MENSHGFLSLVLDSITDHIAVIDETGTIMFVNKTWCEFGKSNLSAISSDWYGINYLSACDKAAQMGDNFGANASKGIRSVIEKKSLFST